MKLVIIMPNGTTEANALHDPELKEMLKYRRPSSDRWKVQYLRAEVGAAVIVIGDITVLGVCIFALWLTHATSDVVAAVLTSAFAAIASMTSAYFGIRAVSNVVQGQQAQAPEGGAEPKDRTATENAAAARPKAA